MFGFCDKWQNEKPKMTECVRVSCFQMDLIFCENKRQNLHSIRIRAFLLLSGDWYKQLSLKLNIENDVSHALEIYRFNRKKATHFLCRKPNDKQNTMCQIVIYFWRIFTIWTSVWCVRQLLVIWILEKQIQIIFTPFEWLCSRYILFLLCFCSVKCSKHFNVYALICNESNTFVVFFNSLPPSIPPLLFYQLENGRKNKITNIDRYNILAGNGQQNPSRKLVGNTRIT